MQDSLAPQSSLKHAFDGHSSPGCPKPRKGLHLARLQLGFLLKRSSTLEAPRLNSTLNTPETYFETMSYRFPPIPPAERSPAQRVADVTLPQMLASYPENIYKDENGCFIGPYAVLLYVYAAVTHASIITTKLTGNLKEYPQSH